MTGPRRLITHNGKTNTIAGWARELDMGKATLHLRLTKGWTVARAFTTPVRPLRQHSTRDCVCNLCGTDLVRAVELEQLACEYEAVKAGLPALLLDAALEGLS
jgi:hypothetical protein